VSDIHSRIREVREDKGLTRKAFGTAIGASEAKVQALENGRQRVDHPILEALSRNLGVDVNWLLLGGDNHHSASVLDSGFLSIQRFDVGASAGTGSLVEAEVGTGHYAFNRSWLKRRGLNPDDLAVISVRGDSMEPELNDNDLILLDRSLTSPKDGEMFVVRYAGDLFVKRVQVMPFGGYTLSSTNKFYSRIVVETNEAIDLKFIGKVVASMHEW